MVWPSSWIQVCALHGLVRRWVFFSLGPLLEILHSMPLLIWHHYEGHGCSYGCHHHRLHCSVTVGITTSKITTIITFIIIIIVKKQLSQNEHPENHHHENQRPTNLVGDWGRWPCLPLAKDWPWQSGSSNQLNFGRISNDFGAQPHVSKHLIRVQYHYDVNDPTRRQYPGRIEAVEPQHARVQNSKSFFPACQG